MPEVQEKAEADDDRPQPGTGDEHDAEASEEPGDAGTEPPSDEDRAKAAEESANEQEYVDRENLDFDPDDGLYTGTAVKGGTKIPGPHDQVDDVEPGDEDEERIADE